MSEQRMMEVEKTANDIISSLADLQLVMLHHPEIGQVGGKEQIYEKLRSTKALAASLMRRSERDDLDLLTARRLQVANGLNALGAVLQRNVLRGGLSGMNDGDIRQIRNLALNVCERIDAYEEMQREVRDDRPAA